MTELFSHIAYLLRGHDCVVLAGIGAFVAVNHGAVLDCENSRMLPPRREITFNGAITSDDGLLTWSVARRRRTSYEQAAAAVADMTAELSRRLTLEGSVTIGRLGTLTRRGQGIIAFEPAAPAILLPELQLRRFVPAPVVSLEIEHRSNERTVAVVRVPFRKRLLAVAASAAILLGLGFTLSTPIDVATAHTASLSIPFTPPVQQQERIDPLPVPDGLQLAMAMPAPGSVIDVPQKPAPQLPERYVMVVASLPTRAQADEYMTRRGDSRLRLLEKDGRYRVYITAGTTQADVTEKAAEIADLRALYPDAWVCRK